jgi:3-dehydroquinate dehydratase-1
MIRIGKVLLGKGPVIAVTVTDREKPRALQKAKRLGARLIEIRIDRFQRLDESWLEEKIRSFKRLGMPLIATIRARQEGGGRRIPDSERLALFKKILSRVDAVDLELSSTSLRKKLVPLTRRKGKRVILSYHNFRRTPSNRRLLSLIEKGKRAGADVVKLAVTPRSTKDMVRLLLLTHQNREKNLISIAMGSRGAPTRILGPLFSSLVTYSFVTRPQAPGQIGLKRLCQEMAFLVPKM